MASPAPTDAIASAVNLSAETDTQAPPAQPPVNEPIEADPDVCWPTLFP